MARTKLERADSYTIAWIAALHIERAAAIAILDERHDEPECFEQNPSDTSSYTWGRIGIHDVVIASLPSGVYGTTSAATTASQLLSSLPWIRVGLMVGIGGAIARPPNQDIRLGDVVVSQPEGTTGGVVQYDIGKARPNDSWELKGSLNAPPLVLLNALAALRAEHEVSDPQMWDILEAVGSKNARMMRRTEANPGYGHQGVENDRLFRSNFSHSEGNTCQGCDPSGEVKRPMRETDEPEIHYGIIASGNTLVKDSQKRDELAARAGPGCMCVEMEAAGLMNNFPCLVIRGICDYADSHKNDRWQRYASFTAAAYAKELLEYVPVRQLNSSPRVLDVLHSVDVTVKGIESLTLDVREEVKEVGKVTSRMDYREALKQLPTAEGAAFDAYDPSFGDAEPRCIPDTRVDLLRRIEHWSVDPEAKSVFWLQGMAGTGKSTVCRSVAESLSNNGHLGGSFFFRRGEGDRGNLSRFFTTIARQLATRIPSTAPYILEALKEDSSITHAGLYRQFEKLIQHPLSTVSKIKGPQPVTIVIDALDECEGKPASIVQILMGATHLGLKVLFSSRPEADIRSAFHSFPSRYEDIALHEIADAINKHDIAVFIRYKLPIIKNGYDNSVPPGRRLPHDWPGESRVQSLVETSFPLFICASTICIFLTQHVFGSPEDNLREIEGPSSGRQWSKLETTYLPVLNRLIVNLSKTEQTEVLTKFRKIVGPIVSLASPLSVADLSSILHIPQTTIHHQLDLLQSVLSVGQQPETPVRLLHASFRDFVLGYTTSNEHLFLADPAEVHAQLARGCQDIMRELLSNDICDLRWPGAFRADIAPEVIDANLPRKLRYACNFWTFHVKRSGTFLHSTEVYDFICHSFLNWVQALSLIESVWKLQNFIGDLKFYSIANTQSNSQLKEFIDDARFWARENLHIVDTAPLQLYSSCLIFAPKASVIRKMFLSDDTIPPWISRLPEVPANWPPYFQHLRSKDDMREAKCIAFSPDSSLIAVGSADALLRIWRVDTGECLHELQGLSGIRDVAFSPDGRMAASIARRMGELCVWSVDTGERLWKADTNLKKKNARKRERFYWERSLLLAFSQDSMLLASSSGSTRNVVTIWNAHTGDCLMRLCRPCDDKFEERIGEVVALRFSSDAAFIWVGFTLMSWNDDTFGMLATYRIDTGVCERTLHIPSECLGISISPDLKTFVTRPGMSVRRVDDGHLLTEFDVPQKMMDNHMEAGLLLRTYVPSAPACFSQDSKLVASGLLGKIESDDMSLGGTDDESGSESASASTSESDSVSVPPSVSVASSDSDDSPSDVVAIQVWSVQTGERLESFQRPSTTSNDPAFTMSPDSRYVAYADTSVYIWNRLADLGWQGLNPLRYEEHRVRLATHSPDNTLIVSVDTNDHVLLWQTETGSFIRRLASLVCYGVDKSYLREMRVSSDSQLVAFSFGRLGYSGDLRILILRIDNGVCFQDLEAGGKVVFSPDSKRLAAYGGVPHNYDEVLTTLWDLDTGRCLLEQNPMVAPYHVVFSQDSTLLIKYNHNGSVDIIRSRDGQGLFKFAPEVNRLKVNWGGVKPLRRRIDLTDWTLETGQGYFAGWNGRLLLWLPGDIHSLATINGETGKQIVALWGRWGGLDIVDFDSEQLRALERHRNLRGVEEQVKPDPLRLMTYGPRFIEETSDQPRRKSI